MPDTIAHNTDRNLTDHMVKGFPNETERIYRHVPLRLHTLA